MTRRPWLPLALLLLLLPVTARPSSEAILLSEEAGGVLELEGERKLEVSGFHGSLALRLGKPGELRFAARSLEGERGKHPVALWLDGSTLRLVPVEGGSSGPVRLEVSMASTLSVRVTASDSKLDISGLHGAVEVRGEKLELTVRSIDGSADLEVEGGTLVVERIAEELRLVGSDLEGRVDHIVGAFTLGLEDSWVECGELQAELEADLEGTEISVTGAAARLRIRSDGGSLQLNGCTGGAELRLSETPLGLYRNEGSIEVDTDAQVQFEGHNGPLNIRGIGSAVRGTQTAGGLAEIETSGAEVLLEALEGSTMIRGADLEVHVKESKGDLMINTIGSTIVVDSPEAAVVIENEFGDVRVENAAKLVKVDSRDGEVGLFGMKGPVQVTAEGPQVEVNWASLGGAEASSVANSRGDVRISLPSKYRCRIDASAPHGSIETDLEDIRVTEDGHHASGILLGGRGPAAQVKKPTIRIDSGGDVYIETISPLPPQP